MNWTERGIAVATILFLVLCMLWISPQIQHAIDHPPPVTVDTVLDELIKSILVAIAAFFVAVAIYYLRSHSHQAA